MAILVTLIKPSNGDVLYDDKSVISNPSYIRGKIGYVPQDIALYEDLSGMDNLKFWAKTYRLYGDNMKNRISEIKKIIGLDDDVLAKKVKTYSGGMKRRVNIGVALLNNPDVVVMDEPTVGIDIISKDYIRDNPGIYPVYSSQTENDGNLGNISSYKLDGEYVTWTTDGAKAGTVFYRNGKFNITNVCGLLKVKDKEFLDTKYLYFLLSSCMGKYVKRDMANAKLMSNVVSEIKIIIPSITRQKEIVDTLDRFDALCNSMTSGIPAHINVLEKQYEYFRNMLLTFN